ncbi:unnamed protein product [Urochloa humidicola]
MGPPSLNQLGSPGREIEAQSALVRAISRGDYTAACRAQWSAAGDTTTSSSTSPSVPPTATPPTAPAAAADVPEPVVGAGSVNPLHHTTTLTPPATVPLGALQTLDATQLFYPDKNINPILVPRLRQEFNSMNDAYEFYKDYAKIAGFSLTTARTSKETRHWLCYRAGSNEKG